MALVKVTSHFSAMLEPIASASFLSSLSIIHASSSDGLKAASFNRFFTSIATPLCSHFERCFLPKVLTPGVKHDFVLEEVSSSFVLKELLKMKSTKATGLEGIPAR